MAQGEIAITDSLGNSQVLTGDELKALLRPQAWEVAELTDTGATFSDGTPSYRAYAENYTNTSGKPIQISVRHTTTSTSNNAVLTVDGLIIWSMGISLSGNAYGTTAIIPNGSTYSISSVNTNITTWNELR